jgi:hypothetical protein
LPSAVSARGASVARTSGFGSAPHAASAQVAASAIAPLASVVRRDISVRARVDAVPQSRPVLRRGARILITSRPLPTHTTSSLALEQEEPLKLALSTSNSIQGGTNGRRFESKFRATIDASFFNPPWVIPADIAKAEILPKLVRDTGYLTRNRMVLLAGGEVEQLPGPEAGLGLIMFDMPNRFDVYLHDTPDRYIFNRDNRRISHGCIRVQNPLQFAALLMRQPIDTINREVARGLVTGNTTRNNLPVPVPVFVVYQTAAGDADGTLQFYPDFYNRDAEIWRKLQKGTTRQHPAMQAGDRSAAPELLNLG